MDSRRLQKRMIGIRTKIQYIHLILYLLKLQKSKLNGNIVEVIVVVCRPSYVSNEVEL